MIRFSKVNFSRQIERAFEGCNYSLGTDVLTRRLTFCFLQNTNMSTLQNYLVHILTLVDSENCIFCKLSQKRSFYVTLLRIIHEVELRESCHDVFKDKDKDISKTLDYSQNCFRTQQYRFARTDGGSNLVMEVFF